MRNSGRLPFFLALIRKELLVVARLLPVTLLITVLLAGFAGLVSFAVMHTVADRDEQPAAIYVGVVMQDDVDESDSFLMRAAITAAKVPRVLHFDFMDEDTAMRRLRNNRLAAVIILEEGFLEAAMYGYDTNIRVLVPETAGFESYLMGDMMDTAVSVLIDVQGVCYAAHDVVREFGFSYAMDDEEAEIAETYLRFLFRRTKWFEEEELLVTGAMDRVQYYGRSVIILLLLTAGIAYAPLFFYRSPAFLQKLKIRRIPALAMPLVPISAMMANGIFLTALLLGGARLLPWTAKSIHLSGQAFGLLLAVIFTCSALQAAVHLLIRDRAGVIFALFAGSILMILFAGGLIPTLWLPKAFSTISLFLPVGYMLTVLGSVFTGVSTGSALWITLGFGAFFWLVAAAAPYLNPARGEGGAE